MLDAGLGHDRRNGRIVELSSVRIGSTLSGWALEMLVVGGQLAIELRRIRPLAP